MSFDLAPYLELDKVQYDAVSRIADYIVRSYKGKYLAIDGKTGRIAFGPSDDASQVIQSALDNADKLVFVKKAEYPISSTLNARSGVKLVSDGAVLKKASDLLLLKIVGVEDFTLEGFTLDGAKIDGHHIVYCENTKRIKILRNKFINPPSDAFMLTFQAVASYYCEVIGNYFDGSGVTGADAFAGLPGHSVVAFNYIKDSPWSGITSGVITRTALIGNIIDSPTKSGISVDNGTSPSYGAVIIGNIIINPGSTGINLGWSKDYPVYDCIIAHNYVLAPQGSGISVLYGRNVQIIGNRVIKPGSNGIAVRGVDNVVIADNVVSDPNDGNHTDYRVADGIVVFADQLTGYPDDRTHFIVKGNIVKDERDTPQMLLGISLHLDSNVPSYLRKGLVAYNVIEGSVEEAIAMVDEVYQAKGWSFDKYDITVKHNYGFVTENSGVATFSGDGSTTTFQIPHGLVKAPSKYGVTPLTPDAQAAFTVSVDDTYITITFDTAPPSGTDNLKFGWWAEL